MQWLVTTWKQEGGRGSPRKTWKVGGWKEEGRWNDRWDPEMIVGGRLIGKRKSSREASDRTMASQSSQFQVVRLYSLGCWCWWCWWWWCSSSRCFWWSRLLVLVPIHRLMAMSRYASIHRCWVRSWRFVRLPSSIAVVVAAAAANSHSPKERRKKDDVKALYKSLLPSLSKRTR